MWLRLWGWLLGLEGARIGLESGGVISSCGVVIGATHPHEGPLAIPGYILARNCSLAAELAFTMDGILTEHEHYLI